MAATGKSGSARVVVACCIVVDQRSAATALQSEISVAEQDFDDARRWAGGCRVFGEGTGRFGVSFACSPPPSTAGYFSPRRWAFPVTRPMRADQLGSGTFSSY